MLPLRVLLGSALLTSIVLTAGCGSGNKGIKVTGQVVANGAPYNAKDAQIALIFTPADASSKAPGCSGQADPKTGNFEMVGPERGMGVQPGQYKVAITANSSTNYKDLLDGAFAPNNTPLTCEIAAQPAEQKILIDIAKKTITKQ